MRTWNRGMFVCVSVGMLLGASLKAEAQTTSSRIVYKCDNGICKMKDDGTSPQRLTDPESGFDNRPTICPSGRAIIFERLFDLYRIDQDGDSETNLTSSVAYEGDPDCHGYGSNTYVVFVSDRDNVNDIFRMTVNGTSKVNLTDSEYEEVQPTWCGSGTVAFSRWDGHDWEIWTMNVSDGENQQQHTNNDEDDQEPSCSPDVQFMVFSRTFDVLGSGYVDIVRYEFQSQDEVVLTTEVDFDAIHPSYSPGGTSIAFAGAESENNFNIYKMTAEPDASAVELTSSEEEETQPDWGELVP